MTVRESIAAALEAAAREIGAEGDLPDLELARARNPAHGDFASSAGMKLARQLRRAPNLIAGELVAAVRLPEGEATAEAAGGYVNFRLSPSWLQRLVGEVAAAGADYGRSDLGRGERVQVEFGSTNPTGPLHVGHGRGYILGDSLASLLAFTGHEVEREFYVNDQNTQAVKFGLSILARQRGEEPPEGGYLGDYVGELAEEARRQGVPPNEAHLRRFGVQQIVEGFERELARIGIHYDSWYRESETWSSGLGQEAIERLTRGGYLVERDGALWFAPALADESAPEEDRVVRRRTGEYTYFASDLGYLLNRFERRGFQRVIEVWGSDHHGYVPRMKSAAAALGIDPDRLVIILNQLVTLTEGKMSKRAGRMVTLSELIDRVGADAVRWFYLSRTADTQMEFDLELATARNRTNPVFYVQYAHARLCGIERTAADRELPETAELDLLREPWELDLARQLAQWPDAVADAARLMEPHRTTFFLYEVADRVSTFYEAGNDNGDFRVVVDDPRLTRARLELCRAARATLRSGLDLLGVAAPDRMERMED
ncbi:MAG TPA: arginine--tRNA ligase [Candidatus Dormibacteraeota bacterium]|nr:arginine--tRNA ligase [Candidatus Dormibacteraeota bacterium]